MRFDYLYRLHSTVGCFLRSFGFRQVSLGLNILNRITSSIPASVAACHEQCHIAEILTNKLWALDFDPAASLWTSTKALILRSACSSHRLRFRPPYPYDTLSSPPIPVCLPSLRRSRSTVLGFDPASEANYGFFGFVEMKGVPADSDIFPFWGDPTKWQFASPNNKKIHPYFSHQFDRWDC